MKNEQDVWYSLYNRLTRVYSPKVLKIMSDLEFADGWWGNTQEERNNAVAFVKKWKEK